MITTIIILSVIIIVLFLTTVNLLDKKNSEIKQIKIDYKLKDLANYKNIEQVSIIQKKLNEEIDQRELYRQRSLELEDAIKESSGIALRNEITKVDCFFDETELSSMLYGLRFMIKEYYKSTSDVKFCINLIEKIEKSISIMMKAKEDKENLSK